VPPDALPQPGAGPSQLPYESRPLRFSVARKRQDATHAVDLERDGGAIVSPNWLVSTLARARRCVASPSGRALSFAARFAAQSAAILYTIGIAMSRTRATLDPPDRFRALAPDLVEQLLVGREPLTASKSSMRRGPRAETAPQEAATFSVSSTACAHGEPGA